MAEPPSDCERRPAARRAALAVCALILPIAAVSIVSPRSTEASPKAAFDLVTKSLGTKSVLLARRLRSAKSSDDLATVHRWYDEAAGSDFEDLLRLARANRHSELARQALLRASYGVGLGGPRIRAVVTEAFPRLLEDHLNEAEKEHQAELKRRLVHLYLVWNVRERYGPLGVDPEQLFRRVLNESQFAELVGASCYMLAKVLANDGRASVEDEGEKVQEAILLLERARREFANVAHPLRLRKVQGDIKLGEMLESDLFELRHLMVGQVAPDIEGTDIEGARFKLSDYRGNIVVLKFGGDWCVPCKQMLPLQKKLVQALRDQPFAMLEINSDPKDRLAAAIESDGYTWPVLWDGGSTEGPIATEWNVHNWPTVYVLDRTGKIRFKRIRGEALEAAVERLLSEMAP